jgi:hypothetical protein
MKRRSFIKNTGAAGLTFFAPSTFIQFVSADPGSDPEADFRQPPLAAWPHTFWFWMNGNVSREGITLDLEAMKRVGIGGALNMDVGTGIPKGPVQYLSAEWVQLKEHAIQEANRLGLEFVMHNCPGWSASGGPWITPDKAMQQITWSETYIAGGKPARVYLSRPATRLNYYRDIAVIAYPSLEGEELLQTVQLSSGSGAVDSALLTGNNPQGVVVHPHGAQKAYLQFEFAASFDACMISFFISAIAEEGAVAKPLDFGERTAVLLEASDDGTTFQLVTSINTGLDTELLLGDKYIVFDIPVTKAKYFRLTSINARRYRQVQFSGITRLKNWMEKTNLRGRSNLYVKEASTIDNNNDQLVTKGSVIAIDKVLNISAYMDQEGLLNWNAPAGNWTILRICFTPTGSMNKAAPDKGIGLECDKYNAAAITFHFNNMLQQLLPAMKTLAAKKKMGLEIDSYEAGPQNWTDQFEQEFKQHRGYEIFAYLPILAGGRIVAGIDTTERFLWDFRRVQADMMAANYYGRFRELCHAHGITTYIEPYDTGPMEEMQIGSKADVNLGEFWNGITTFFPIRWMAARTPKLVASIAHVNGQPVAGAEAFTSAPDCSRWQEYPFALKATGDKIFTKGVNRMVIHRYAHQPHPTAVPGMTMGPWGIHFDRTTTWWEQSKGWLQYMARCQYLLQQGRFIADLLYFTGEDANMYTRANADALYPMPPEGYDYDLVNVDIVLNQVTIVNNRIQLQHGTTYRVFLLQNYKAVSLPLLRKLRELVQAGMILIGAKPERSTGLTHYADKDEAFHQLTRELWGSEKSQAGRRFGKGWVFWDQPLIPVLQQMKIHPDFEYTSRSGDAPVLYTHRKMREGDLYFISNQRRSYEELVCIFRVANKQPELWDPVTGTVTPLLMYELTGERIRVPVQLGPYGSVFVLFRKPAASRRFHAVQKDHQTIISTKSFAAITRTLYQKEAGHFTICFWARPEISILLNAVFNTGTIAQPWTEFYAVYPQAGNVLYSKGHATCGIAVGVNGVAVWEKADGDGIMVLAAPVAIEGWSHITVQYNAGMPAVYVNGQLIQKGIKSRYIVHPAANKTWLQEGASYYNGDMSRPELFSDVLPEEKIRSLAMGPVPLQATPYTVEMKDALMIKENGQYVLHNNKGETTAFTISNINPPVSINGPWQVTFPPGLGAPSSIQLSTLISLHKHADAGVQYFSGTATYITHWNMPALPVAGKHILLDLGRVEVIAEVIVNDRNLGIIWTRPYQVDITTALQKGNNRLVIKVTNLWPNRLIGDEQYPDVDKYAPGAYTSGHESLVGGYIEQLPDWYIKGEPKPSGNRIGFATWKHFIKNAPLLESGLIGPVTLQEVIHKPVH